MVDSTTVQNDTVPSRVQRAADSKLLRRTVPRSSHGDWVPASDRPDPLDLLQEEDKTRLQFLLPIKYGRMVASPFAFLRGSAVVMASDLSNSPATGLKAILCGDAHLANFGLFATPERELVFDINDFDETFPGPWEWDLKRLAASAVVSGRTDGFKESDNIELAFQVAAVYRDAMLKFAEMPTLDVWYFSVDASAVQKVFDVTASKKASKASRQTIEKARTHTQERSLEKLTLIGPDGNRQFVSQPPLLVPVHAQNITDFADAGKVDLTQFKQADAEKLVKDVWQSYLHSLPMDRRYLLTRFRLEDAALRVGGVGSVGTRCYIVLLRGGATDDALILQLKEAEASALTRYLKENPFPDHAERVVVGQRLMQAASDSFLGWHKTEGTNREFYWRQFKDMKGSFDVNKLDRSGFQTYVQVCATCLARAHARTGDPASIAGYLGKSDIFPKAIARFAQAYADQTEKDYEALAKAVKNGRIAAEQGI